MRDFHRLSSLLICSALSLVACHRADEAQPRATAQTVPAAEAAPAAPVAPPGAIDTSPGVPGTQDLAPLAKVGPKMQAESKDRLRVKVPVERVFAALADQGITLASQHQVLATTAAASYCSLGVTSESIAIAVCEYPTAEAAEAGRKMMSSRYAKLVPDAERVINGSTLVTVANASSHRDVRDRVIHTFQAL